LLLLREIRVEKILREWLVEEEHWTKIEPKRYHGVDIHGWDGEGRERYIEVEGNMKPKAGQPLTASQKYTHLNRMIGQICMRMGEGGQAAKYAICVPVDDYYVKKLDALGVGISRLSLGVFLVEGPGRVCRVRA
jgi:hypothetical protein